MELSLIILLSTLALVYSMPNIFVTVSGHINYDGTNPNMVVKLDGEDRAIITDKDRVKYQFSDDVLGNCILEYKDYWPYNVYFHDPTTWGDVYNSNGWKQVYRTVKPLHATITNIFTKRETVSLKVYNNTQSTPMTGKATISKTFENRITTTWSEEQALTVTGEVSVGMDLKVIDIGASVSISKAKSWGKSFEHSQSTALTDSAELEFTVPPHDCVYVRTEVSKTMVNLRVEYEARLDGDMVINGRYVGRPFIRLDITDVMRGCNYSTKLIITEYITLDLVNGIKVQAFSDPAETHKLKLK